MLVVSDDMCELMGEGPLGVIIVILNCPRASSSRRVGRGAGDASILIVPGIDPKM
jgi:hypothetical protein